MRKQGLPLQRLMSGETPPGPRQRPALPRRLRAVRGRRRGPRRRPGGRAEAGRSPSAGSTARRRTSPRPRCRPSCAAVPRGSGDAGVVVAGDSDVWVRLSRCCTPVPGDEIVGFVTRGHGVSVHRADCANMRAAAESEPDRLVEVQLVAERRLGVPGRHPGRGARPAPPAVRRHPGPVRPARQHPVGLGDHHPATAWRSASSPSRWATPSTWATFSRRSATSRACTTSTGSAAPKLTDGRP